MYMYIDRFIYKSLHLAVKAAAIEPFYALLKSCKKSWASWEYTHIHIYMYICMYIDTSCCCGTFLREPHALNRYIDP